MPAGPLVGKTCLVTGASSGLGRAAAEQLASMGATLVLTSNHDEGGKKATREITETTGNPSVEFIHAEFASLDSVRSLATSFSQGHERLDLLLNNAAVVRGARNVTGDGLEEVFQVNYLSPFLLTLLLTPRLKKSAPSRVLNVVSSIHTHLDIDDLQEEKHYDGIRSYGKSKTALILFTFELARRLEGAGVSVNCVHPGAVRTQMGRDGGGLPGLGIRLIRPFVMSAEKAARAVVYVATSPELEGVTGTYFFKDRPRETSGQTKDEELSKKLWDQSLQLAGLKSNGLA